MPIPIEVSWEYQLPPITSSDWVEVTSIENNTVHVTGVYGDIAGWISPTWKFPDLVVNYKVGGYYLLTEDRAYTLSTEDGFDIIAK